MNQAADHIIFSMTFFKWHNPSQEHFTDTVFILYLLMYPSAGSSVKNLPAFNLLQASLLRSQDSLLCCKLLRTLQTIWERDPANFFLLEWTVQSMAQLAACVWCKPVAVQKMFFSMLEMV